MIEASGFLFLAPDNTALFVRRSSEGDEAGKWAFPGGKTEDGETALEGAIRECEEEIGIYPDGKPVPLTRRIGSTLGDEKSFSDKVDFTTFAQKVKSKFEPMLNEEHTAYCWAPVNAPPEPLHDGCRVALRRLSMDELDIAKAIVAGELTSPQTYENLLLVDMRLTGTGVAYRVGLDEFVWRDPAIYLTDRFLERSQGLPVIMEHPESSTLNSKEFADRIVGILVQPYIKGNEVWGIAKIYDDATKRMIEKHQLSTSPAVVFRNPKVNSKGKTEDGSDLLIEGKPSLLDHLAICERGVWDKGKEAAGVRADSIKTTTGVIKMTEEERKAAEAAKSDAEDRSRKDSEKLDKLLTGLDSMSRRMDAMEGEMAADKAKKDAFEKEEEKKKADAEEEAKKKEAAGGAEEGDAKKAAADKAKKDAEEKEAEEKKKADASAEESKKKEEEERKDAEDIRKRIADVEAKLPKAYSDADYSAMVAANTRADALFRMHSKKAPRFMSGESVDAYRRRLSSELKEHSPNWKTVNIFALTQNEAFDIAEKQIYADAEHAGRHPAVADDAPLQEIVSEDITGRKMISFAGNPKAWMQPFMQHRRVARFTPRSDQRSA